VLLDAASLGPAERGKDLPRAVTARTPLHGHRVNPPHRFLPEKPKGVGVLSVAAFSTSPVGFLHGRRLHLLDERTESSMGGTWNLEMYIVMQRELQELGGIGRSG
jgi:hypothetical protein